MYEHRTHAPLHPWTFLRRLGYHFLVTLAIIAFSLLMGMAGYHYFEGLNWVDAFLDAAMILGGMGPVHMPQSEAGKLFAGFYALYSGLVFLVMASILLAPVIHRILHKFHCDGVANEEDEAVGERGEGQTVGG